MADPVAASNVVTLALIGGGVALATLGMQIFQAIVLKRMDRKQEVAAVAVAATVVKVEAVKVAVAAATVKVDEIKTLTNGSHGAVLETLVTSAHLLFDAKPTEDNRRKMAEADDALAKHREREAMVLSDRDKGHMYTQNSYVVK